MSYIKSILHRWFQKCVPIQSVKIETSTLREPDDNETREIKIRMVYITCSKCDRLLGVYPRGIVYDPKYDEEE